MIGKVDLYLVILVFISFVLIFVFDVFVKDFFMVMWFVCIIICLSLDMEILYFKGKEE